jgi:hypothetical protein
VFATGQAGGHVGDAVDKGVLRGNVAKPGNFFFLQRDEEKRKNFAIWKVL